MKIKSVLLIVCGLILFNPSFKSYSAVNHKTYRGKFQISGIFTYLLDGSADYEYIEEPDGSRIYDGKFSWDYSSSRCKCSIRGQFFNNRQSGEWHYTEEPIDRFYTVNKKEITLNFNDLGYLNGDFRFYTYTNNYGDETKLDITGKFENGILVSCTLNRSGNVRLSKFNEEYKNVKYTSTGKPTGTWTYQERLDKYPITVSFDSYGKVSKAGYRDPRTGDWIDCSYRTNIPSTVYDLIRRAVAPLFMRSTPGMKKISFK